MAWPPASGSRVGLGAAGDRRRVVWTAGVGLRSESRSYITGKSVSASDRERILEVAKGVAGVEAVNELIAIVAGADEIFVELNLDLQDELTTPQIEEVLDTLEESLKREIPGVVRLRVDLNPRSVDEGEGEPAA